MRLLSRAADHPGRVGRTQGRRRVGWPGAVRDLIVDPDASFNAAHTVDEKDRRRKRAVRRGVDCLPPACGQFHIDRDGRGGFLQLLFELKARAVRRIPAIDAEPHLLPGRARPSCRRCDVTDHAVLSSSAMARPSRATIDVRAFLVTRYLTGTRSASAVTWVTTPTMRLPWARVSSVVATTSRVSPSRVPNPSSRKMESSRAAPAVASALICDDRARASARDAWKVSPPDRVRTHRLASASAWSMTNRSPLS